MKVRVSVRALARGRRGEDAKEEAVRPRTRVAGGTTGLPAPHCLPATTSDGQPAVPAFTVPWLDMHCSEVSITRSAAGEGAHVQLKILAAVLASQL